MTTIHRLARLQSRPSTAGHRAVCRCGWATPWVYDQRSARQAHTAHAQEPPDA